MKILERILFKIKDNLTKPKFDFVSKDNKIFYTAADPDDFFAKATELKYCVFTMACLQSWVQTKNGKWIKDLVVAFENQIEMYNTGIKELPRSE